MQTISLRPFLLLLLVLSLALLPASAVTWQVTTAANTGPGSLREACSLAGAGDTITFSGATFTGPESFVVIRLTSGMIPLTQPITIQGILNTQGNNKIIITGDADSSNTPNNGDSPAFSINSSTAGLLTLNQLRIERCSYMTAGGGAITVNSSNVCNIALTNSQFRDNYANGDGGVLFIPQFANNIELFIGNCLMENNTSQNNGGAISVGTATRVEIGLSNFWQNTGRDFGGALYLRALDLVMNRCDFSQNVSTTGSGGAIYTHTCSAMIARSTMRGNSALTFSRTGGALDISNSLTSPFSLQQCTISGNSCASAGGGIHVSASSAVSLQHCTITGNTVTLGNGGGGGVRSIGSQISYTANIIAANTDRSAVFPPSDDVSDNSGTSLGYNIIGNNTGSSSRFTQTGDLTGTNSAPLDAGLAPLSLNVGATPTHPLYPHSPAIDHVPTSSFTTDQRNQARPSAAAYDAGAVEIQKQTYEDWAAQKLSAYPVNQRDRNDDPDHDGQLNLLEFYQNSDPTAFNESYVALDGPPNSRRFYYTISNTADLSGISMEIQKSENLVDWSAISQSNAAVELANASRTRYSVAEGSGAEKRFFRMLLTDP